MMQQGISPQVISIDCLNTSKHFSIIDCINTLESSSSQVRQTFNRLTQEHQSMADDWYRLMQRRGWYQVQEARPESRTQTANFINSIQSSIQSSIPGQSFTASSQPVSQYGGGHQVYGGSSQYGYGQGGFGPQISSQQSAAQYQGSPVSGAPGTSWGSGQYLK